MQWSFSEKSPYNAVSGLQSDKKVRASKSHMERKAGSAKEDGVLGEKLPVRDLLLGKKGVKRKKVRMKTREYHSDWKKMASETSGEDAAESSGRAGQYRMVKCGTADRATALRSGGHSSLELCADNTQQETTSDIRDNKG